VTAAEVVMWICSDYTHACVKLPDSQQPSNKA
jgi:hypothetical protein